MTQNDRAFGVSGTCPDLDTLADLHAGVLDDSSARILREHVAGCASCPQVLGALDATVASLAALPAVQMPAEVAARIDHALAVEAGRVGLSDDLTSSLAAAPPMPASNVHRLPTHPHPAAPTAPESSGAGATNVASLSEHRAKRAGRGRLLLAAAAAAAAVGIGAVVITQGDDDPAGTQADKQTEQTEQTAGAAPGDAQAFSSPKDVLEKGAIENGEVSEDIAGPMAEQSARLKCYNSINPRPSYAPEAVQAGTYDGKDAYAFVFPTKDPQKITMIIVNAADCSDTLTTVDGTR